MRRWAVITFLLGLLTALSVYSCVTCAPPRSLEGVRDARAGRALGNLAIVYSAQYYINSLGWEKYKSYDVNKPSKIYRKLVDGGVLTPADVFVPEPVTEEQVLLVHSRAFVDSLKSSSNIARYLDAPVAAIMPAGLLDKLVLSTFRQATGGTIQAGRLAMKFGLAVNLSGGYTQARREAGAAFSIYADIPIAIAALRKEGVIGKAMVIDLDAVRGAGLAECLAGVPEVTIVAMNGPGPEAEKDAAAPLKDGAGDGEYLAALRERLPAALDQAKPDLVYCVVSANVMAGDPLGKLKLSAWGVAQRDAYVIEQCRRRNIPLAIVLGGGFTDAEWQAQAASIARTIAACKLAAASAPAQP
jgi:histone deacetylase 11